MYLKWIGLALLISSLLLGAIMATDIQIFQRTVSYALVASDKTPMVDRVVPVPPFNRTEGDRPVGWVGFNMTLPNQGKNGYEAYGIILPNDPDEKPEVLMRIVNATPGGGFDLLIFDRFSEQAWNASYVYAIAELPSFTDPNQYYKEFRFYRPDNASKYCAFFRAIKNGTDDFNILITIKESWLEPGSLIPSTAPFMTVIVATGIVGSGLVVVGFVQPRKKRPRRRLGGNMRERSSVSCFGF